MQVAVHQATISWEAAHAAVEAAVREAQTIGARINVAVADAGTLAVAGTMKYLPKSCRP